MGKERRLNRLHGFNYSSAGYYFVTINVHGREPVFASAVNGTTGLNVYGCFAERCWSEIPGHFAGCFTDEYIIMPDHVHGIIIIGENAYNEPSAGEGPQYEKLPVIIGSYKSAVSKLIHRSGRKDFRWQKSYHDRIIRDQQELESIREYIRLNPERWLAAR